MKTVIINGSPRNDGNTAALISVLKQELHGEIVQFDTYNEEIHPCTDCRICWKKSECPFEDTFGDLLTAINEADVVVIASPVYFSELTGPLLSALSRLQYIWISETIRHEPVLNKRPRKGIILLAGGGLGSHKKALGTATCLLKQMGATVIGSVCSLQTDHLPAEQDTTAINGIKSLVKDL